MKLLILQNTSGGTPRPNPNPMKRFLVPLCVAFALTSAGCRTAGDRQAEIEALVEAGRFAEAEAEREKTRHQTEVAGKEALQYAYFAKVMVDRAQESLLWPNAKADMALAFWQIGHGCKCVDWLYLYHRLYCHTDAAQFDAERQRISLAGFRYDPDTKRVIQVSE